MAFLWRYSPICPYVWHQIGVLTVMAQALISWGKAPSTQKCMVSGLFHTLLLYPLLSPRDRTPGTHYLGVQVGPRAGMDKENRQFLHCQGIKPRPSSPLPVTVSTPILDYTV